MFLAVYVTWKMCRGLGSFVIHNRPIPEVYFSILLKEIIILSRESVFLNNNKNRHRDWFIERKKKIWHEILIFSLKNVTLKSILLGNYIQLTTAIWCVGYVSWLSLIGHGFDGFDPCSVSLSKVSYPPFPPRPTY